MHQNMDIDLSKIKSHSSWSMAEIKRLYNGIQLISLVKIIPNSNRHPQIQPTAFIYQLWVAVKLWGNSNSWANFWQQVILFKPL